MFFLLFRERKRSRERLFLLFSQYQQTPHPLARRDALPPSRLFVFVFFLVVLWLSCILWGVLVFPGQRFLFLDFLLFLFLLFISFPSFLHIIFWFVSFFFFFFFSFLFFSFHFFFLFIFFSSFLFFSFFSFSPQFSNNIINCESQKSFFGEFLLMEVEEDGEGRLSVAIITTTVTAHAQLFSSSRKRKEKEKGG